MLGGTTPSSRGCRRRPSPAFPRAQSSRSLCGDEHSWKAEGSAEGSSAALLCREQVPVTLKIPAKPFLFRNGNAQSPAPTKSPYDPMLQTLWLKDRDANFQLLGDSLRSGWRSRGFHTFRGTTLARLGTTERLGCGPYHGDRSWSACD